MRILIADRQCEQRIAVEKSLRLLGYFRVFSVASFQELTTLTHYSPSLYERFDLLILDAELVSSAKINVLDFCVNSPRLKHVLIYGSPSVKGRVKALSDPSLHKVRLVDSISYAALSDFLSLIDKDSSDKIESLYPSVAFESRCGGLVESTQLVCPGTGGQVVKSYCSHFAAQTPSD